MVDRSRRRPRSLGIAVAVSLVLVLLAAAPASAQEAPPPSTWPASPNASPRIEGHPHGVRIAGNDRYSTSLALALTLRGTGGYPFSTPDRSSGGATGLEDGSGWWGVGTCPRAIIVVAGDSPADALAASALSDPTDQSTEPFLQRSAAADPLFDPPGGFARVDTDSAPILVTRSARQGATQLAVATRVAAQDLASGGCTTARQAIVVGGTAAVPAGVDDELVSIGYTEVFRVSGPTRYATAANVARSLGTAPAPSASTACVDVRTDDGDARMGFYGNSVIELRDSATECRVLGRTVVLADGLTGADALAAGWWTSFWQVPVLLHGGSGSLPAATVEALETMQIDHLVVLGGTARLSNAVAAQAASLTGAEVIRVAGADRYATSVQMAQRFGGWWPTGDGADFEASMVCLAASTGEGGAARGWPDALSAGPWCGAASGAASNPGAPVRALAPTDGASPRTSSGGPGRPAHDAVPVLLVPVGSQVLPASVGELLAGAFDGASVTWCSSAGAGSCRMPGFVVAFGGGAVVGEAALTAASRLVSGNPAIAGPEPARRDPMFHTRLDMAPVFGTQGTGTEQVCAERDGYAGLRWLAVFGDAAASRLHAAGDVMLGGRYVADVDSVVRSPGVGAPTCVAFAPTPGNSAALRGVTLAGRGTPVGTFSFAPANRFALSGPITRSGPQSASGIDSDLDPADGGVTTRTFISPSQGVEATSRTATAAVSAAVITVTITRGVDSDDATAPDRFSAAWSLDTPVGTVTGTARGEALLAGVTWQLRGRTTFTGGTWNVASGSGGFTAALATNAPGDSGDDAISWRIDGLVAG
jgi:putative cell wall-binding protein